MIDLGRAELIDKLIAAPKKLVSAAFTWQMQAESDQQATIKSPIEMGGEIPGKLIFICNARQFGNEIETAFILSYDDVPIERMLINPRGEHINQMLAAMPQKLKGMVMSAGQNRYYSWKNNRNFGFPPHKHHKNTPASILLEEPVKNFSDAVNYFFRQTIIESVELPEPPFKQMILAI